MCGMVGVDGKACGEQTAAHGGVVWDPEWKYGAYHANHACGTCCLFHECGLFVHTRGVMEHSVHGLPGPIAVVRITPGLSLGVGFVLVEVWALGGGGRREQRSR